MQEIADWLEKLGMSEYAQRFAENRIDVSVLPDLTDQDLKELGVLLGDRRKILRAIAKLDAPSENVKPTPNPSSTLTVAAAPPVPIAQGSSERHLVTVMLCDLVDSTDIAAKLDAEAWRDLVHAYLNAASAAVMEMGGTVAKKLRHGLVALFGYPAAQENDCECAVRAALAIQQSLAELNRINADNIRPVLAARITRLRAGGDRRGGRNFRRPAERCCAGTIASRAGRGGGYGASTTASRRAVHRRGAGQSSVQR